MSGWPVVNLREVVYVTDYVANGSFESIRLNVTYSDEPEYAVLVRLVDHNNGWAGPRKYVDRRSYDFLKKSTLKAGDIIVANVGANAGTVFRAPNLGVPMTLGPNSVLCRPYNSEEYDDRFLYYFLSGPAGQSLIESIIGGSAQPKFNKTELRRLSVPMPPVGVQRAIAGVLGAIDDKIAGNIELAKTADALIRAQYAGLQSERRVKIGELVVAHREPVNPSQIEPETSYIGLEHVPRRNMWMSTTGDAASISSGKSRFMEGDILFGKLRPYFHKVISASTHGVCSTDILVLRPINEELGGFALAALSSDEVIVGVTAASEGTRMPRTNWKDLSAIEVPWPEEGLALRFSAGVISLQNSVAALVAENETLAELRDTLLPELMSGRLRVKDIESVVTDAV